jgi:hypothetical protein
VDTVYAENALVGSAIVGLAIVGSDNEIKLADENGNILTDGLGLDGGGMGHQKPLIFACGTGTTSNNYGQVYSMPTPSAGWHMFTETWDGYSFKVYLDGELKYTDTRYTEKTPVFYNANYNALFIGGESSES